ncbi:MAG: DUF3568 family protein [Planctomycetota bacterium]
MEAARSDERSRSFSRKLSRTLVAATLVVAVAASGCELLLLGGAAGAGAGAASYYMGRLEKTVPHDVPETHDAAVAALKDLGLPILQERSDQVSSHIESEFADEKRVWIDIEAVADSSSDVTIRVGYLGDRSRALRILDTMEERLEPASTE